MRIIRTHGPSGGLSPVRIGQNGGRLGATAGEAFVTISTLRDILALIAARGRPQVPPPSTPDGRADDPAQRATTRLSDRDRA